MTNNDILIRLRYALDLPEAELATLFRLGGLELDRNTLEGYLRREDEEGHVRLGDSATRAFLSGLIIEKRGPRETDAPPPPKGRLTNNEVLKALRVALELKDDDLVAIMALAETEVSKPEISALFRKPDHPKYRECGDQFLRRFLAGLTARLRGSAE